MRCSKDWTPIGIVPYSNGFIEVGSMAVNHIIWTAQSAQALLHKIEKEPHSFSVVVIDAQRSPDPKDQPESYRVWMHGVDSLMECMSLALQEHGRAFVELEPTDLAVYLETIERHGLHVVEMIAWQKKYSGQNSRRDFENLHDYILVIEPTASQIKVPITFLPFKVAGKSEDAAREFNEVAHQLLGEGALHAPQPLKPSTLFQWLVRNRMPTVTDSLLDLTSCAASWSSQAQSVFNRTIDVVWPDEPWFEGGWWFLNQKLSGLETNKWEPSASSNQTKPDKCECKFAITAHTQPVRSNVCLDFRGEGPDMSVKMISGEIENLIDGVQPFFRGRVLDSFGSLKLLATSAEKICGLLSGDGLAVLELEGDWLGDLRHLIQTVGHARQIGSLVLHDGDETVGPAQILLLLGASAHRFYPHPLWQAKEHNFSNKDADPRGPWRNPGHKGAKSGGPGTSFRLFRPPYRWNISSGKLPPGLWRLNPVSGVVWGTPTELGSWDLRVQATDDSGKSATAKVTFEVVESIDAQDVHLNSDKCSWLFAPLKSGGPLRVAKKHVRLPVGRPSSVVMKASGGEPCVVEIPAPGKALASGRTRYWEFNTKTLLSAILEDRVLFPRNPAAKPSIRKFQPANSMRHAAMPSVMGIDGLAVRDFFWQRISRTEAGDVGLDWRGAVTKAELWISTGAPGSLTGTARACTSCADTSLIFQGCCKEHAIQTHGVIALGQSKSEPEQLFDLAGRPAGVLFVDIPVTAEQLQLLLLANAPGKVLAVKCSTKTNTDFTLEKVSWQS
jgi:hypothetical protein